MRFKTVFASTLLLFVLLSTIVGQNPSLRIRASELNRTPIMAGVLKLTFIKFQKSVMLNGVGYIGARVENTSDDFATFSPQRLLFLNQDKTQVDMLCALLGPEKLALRDYRIAPGANIQVYCQLSNIIRLPVSVYYDEKELAEIVD